MLEFIFMTAVYVTAFVGSMTWVLVGFWILLKLSSLKGDVQTK